MKTTQNTFQLDLEDNITKQQILEKKDEDNNFNFAEIENINKQESSNTLEIVLSITFFTLIGLLIYYKEILSSSFS